MIRKLLAITIAVGSLAVVTALAVLLLGLGLRGESSHAAEALPDPTSDVLQGGTVYTSDTKGYSISLPSGWSTSPTSVDLDRTSTDIFYLAATGEPGVAPTVSITRESLARGVSSQEYADFWLDYLKDGWKYVSEAQPLEISGVQGYLIDYDGPSANRSIEMTSAVFVNGTEGWELVFAVPGGRRSEFRPLLAAVLGSLTLR